MARRALALSLAAAALAVGPSAASAAAGPTPSLLPKLALPDPVPAARLALSAESGTRSNEAEAQSFYGAVHTAAAVARAGRLTGYELVYWDARGDAYAAHPGVVLAATVVDLFSSAGAADAYVVASQVSLAALGNLRPGAEALGQPSFGAPPQVGERAFAVRLAHRVWERRTAVSLVRFRVGRLLATTLVEAGSADEADRTALRMASALAARIEGVLAGRLAPEAPKPPGAPTVGGVGPPAAGADPSTAAVSAAEFAAPVKVRREGYGRSDVALSEYERVFGATRLGRSRLSAAAGFVERLPFAVQAAAELAQVRYLLRHERTILLGAFRGVAPARLAGRAFVRAERLRRVDAGEEAAALRASFSGSVQLVVAAVREGALVQTVELLSEAGATIGDRDVDLLLQRLAARMRAAPLAA